MRAILLAVLAAAPALALRAPAAAAQGPDVEPVVQAGFVGTVRPALTAGARWTVTPLPPLPRIDPETGMPEPVPALYSLQLVATAGVTFAEPRGEPVDFTAMASAGMLWPLGGRALSGAGPVVLAGFRPSGVGAGVRAQSAFHALALQAGALWPLDDDGPELVVTVDVSTTFIRDATVGLFR
jgi:hypothetical protein